MCQKAPIFIGGVNRSGTSLMRQLIGSHSQVAVPPTEFGFFRRISDLQKQIEDREEFVRKVEEVLSWSKVQGWGLSKNEVLLAAREAEPTYRGLFLLILDHYRKSVGKIRIAEKSTHYELHLDVFDKWFEQDYYFIHLIRNPIDTFASQIWYMGQKREIGVWGWAEAWTNSVRVGLGRSFARRQRYRMVRYENLVSNTEGILQELCAFLGLEFERERQLSMVDYEQKENSSFKSVAPRKTYNNLIRTSDDLDRAKMLSDEELNVIARLCGPTAKLVGYDVGSWDLGADNLAIQAKSALDQMPMQDMLRLTASYTAKRTWTRVRRRFRNRLILLEGGE